MATTFCWCIDADGVVWALMQTGTGAQMSPSDQDFAQEISGSPDGTGWIISTQAAEGGNVIMAVKPGTDTWVPVPNPAAAIKLDAKQPGVLWTINADGEVWSIYPFSSQTGVLISPPGQDFAMEVAVAPDGTVWVISTEVGGEGNLLQSWNPDTQQWTVLPPPANAIKLSVDPGGNVWTVNSIGEVWMLYPNGGGQLMSPSGQDFAQDISVGPDGTVWIISTQGEEGGDAIMWWTGDGPNWNTLPNNVAAITLAGALSDA